MMLQIDIPPELNKKLKIEKLKRNHRLLQETVLELLQEKLK